MPTSSAVRVPTLATLATLAALAALVVSFAHAEDRPDLSGLATATASSQQPGNDVENALDGDEGTRWCAADDSAPQWWRADFPTPQPLAAIGLDWEFPGSDYRYRVEVSKDGESWQEAVDAGRGAASPALHEIASDVGADVRSVRVTFLGGRGWGSIREVRLLAPPGTTVPPPAVSARDRQLRALAREVTAPAGFRATIFATSAEANYPVFVAATADGTLFVSSDGNGSIGRDPDRGRLLRLRDTDGDGTADDVRVFADGVDSPRGLVFVDDRLVVLHPPHVTAFRDTDGDGIADERTRLVSGIAFDYSQRPADHTSNGLALGIDGWIYAAIGDFGFMEAQGSDGASLRLRGGGVVRFRPDGSGLDLFARGTRNTLEVAVGPLLDMVARDNTNDGGGWNVRLHAFTGLEDHGYPRRYMHFADEVVAPLADYGGGSGTGACWIDEPWMPQEWNDAPYTCDWGVERIFRHPLTASGGGYEAGQQEFLRITRATDLDVDAVGHVYAASWRGGGFTWSGPGVGFIARLSPETSGGIVLPDVERATAPELLSHLAGPSHRLRLEAERALLRRGMVPGAAEAIESLAGDAAARPASRVAAIFTLALGCGADAVPALGRLAADPAVAAWAVRALGDLAASGVAVPRDVLHAALRSDDARTRREGVVAIARSADGGGATWLVPLVADPDRIVAHTTVEGLVRMAARSEGEVIRASAAALDDPRSAPGVHRGAARVLGEIHSVAAVDALLDRLSRATDPARRGDLAWAAARLWRRESEWTGDGWGTRPDTRGPYYALEEWEASPRLAGALEAAIGAAPAGELPTLARMLGLHRIPAAVVVPRFVARRDADGVAARSLASYLDLSDEAPPDEAVPLLAAAAVDRASPVADRLAAIRVLARSQAESSLAPLVEAALALEATGAPPEEVAALRRLLGERFATLPDLGPVVALAAGDPARAALADQGLLAIAGSTQARSALRGAAAARLETEWARDATRRRELVAASVASGSRVLATRIVAAAEAEDPALRELALAAIGRLGIDAAKVREIASDTGPTVGQRPADETLALVDERRGDRTVGAELFAAKKCVACHAVGVDSAGAGPSLANAAGIYSRHQLAESILLPNKSIAQGFATTALVLDDGRSIVGFVTSEGADELRLRDGQGAEHRIPKSSIEERTKLPTSVMPEGLLSDLSVSQFASLVDYIESLGGE